MKQYLHLVALMALMPPAFGCTQPPPPPNMDAVVTVVEDVYRANGFDRPVLFLATKEACSSFLDPCESGVANDLRTRLETSLPVKVHPTTAADYSDLSLPALTPVLPETGEIGVIVRLGRFRQDEEGSLQVHVWVGRSGLDGLGLRYTLVPEDDGWSISDIVLEGVA